MYDSVDASKVVWKGKMRECQDECEYPTDVDETGSTTTQPAGFHEKNEGWEI